jgi:hypothetical protein
VISHESDSNAQKQRNEKRKTNENKSDVSKERSKGDTGKGKEEKRGRTSKKKRAAEQSQQRCNSGWKSDGLREKDNKKGRLEEGKSREVKRSFLQAVLELRK